MTDTIDRSDQSSASTPHDAEVIDRLVVRFAGDSGDGMQLTGDRFTSVSAIVRQRPVDDARLPGRDPRPSRHGQRRVAASRSTSATTTSPRPGDEPNVLVAMNPAALKADLGRLEPGGTADRQRGRVRRARPRRRPSYAANPLDDGTRQRLPRDRGADDVAHARRPRVPLGVKPRDAERSKNFFALGLVSWHVLPADASRRSSGSTSGSQERAGAGRQHRRVQRRLQLRRDHRAVRAPLRGPPGQAARRRVHEHHRQHGAGVGSRRRRSAGQAAGARSGQLPDHAGQSDILHELSKHKHFGVRTVQAEDEIAAAGMALGAAFAGHLGVTTTSGPGLALKSETISARPCRSSCRCCSSTSSAAGPSTGLPTKTEAADLNIAMYGRHGEAPLPIVAAYSPAQLLRRRDRGGPHRAQVPHAGDPAVATATSPTAPSRGGCPTSTRCPTSRVPFATELNHIDDDGNAGVLAVPPRPGDARPTVGDPRHARSDAPRRRAREGGRHAATSTTRPRTTSGWSACGPPRSPASPTTSRRSRSSATPTPTCCVLGWGSTWAAIDAAVQRTRAARHKAGLGPPHPPQPAAAEPRRGAAALPEGDRARAQPRPAVPHRARRVPRRRQVGHQGAGPAVHRAASSKTAIDQESRSIERSDTVGRRSPRRRTGRATRRSAGAPVAATTASSWPSSS